MNGTIRKIAGTATVAALLITGAGIAPAEAAPRKFTSCHALNKAYSGGVAKTAKIAKRTPGKQKVSVSLYRANAGIDWNKNGVACERGDRKPPTIVLPGTVPTPPVWEPVTPPPFTAAPVPTYTPPVIAPPVVAPVEPVPTPPVTPTPVVTPTPTPTPTVTPTPVARTSWAPAECQWIGYENVSWSPREVWQYSRLNMSVPPPGYWQDSLRIRVAAEGDRVYDCPNGLGQTVRAKGHASWNVDVTKDPNPANYAFVFGNEASPVVTQVEFAEYDTLKASIYWTSSTASGPGYRNTSYPYQWVVTTRDGYTYSYKPAMSGQSYGTHPEWVTPTTDVATYASIKAA